MRGCDSRSLDELADEVARLAEAARAGTLAPEELRGSTFTVTSAGKLAGLFHTPIVNHPEVAIIGIGRIAPRPVVRDGEVVVRKTGTIAVTFDHRVIDGARASEFGLAVIGRLESPAGADLGRDFPRRLEVLLEQPLDARRADPSLEPPDHAIVLDQEERGNGVDVEAQRHIGLLADVDAGHAKPASFLARQMREQALHSSGRA